MYFQGRPLQGNNAPDMLVTNDGHVFTRQTTIQTSQGKPIQAVANSSGVSIQANASESLKDAWHIPHIPTAMDIAGR
jgi:hypothetical protein